jgi:rhodanese-related sulfurtransferase
MDGSVIWWVVGAVALFLMLRPSVPADAKLSPAEVKEAIAKEKALQLVDVRSHGEFGGGHLAGAKNIPVGDIGSRLMELYKEKPLIVYCRSGARSSAALKQLRAAGYAQAKHMNGGIMAWQGAGLPTTR